MRLHRTKWRASANSRWSAWALCGVHLPFEAQRENRSRQQNRRGKRLVHVPYSSNHSTLSTRSVAALRFSKAGDPLSQSCLLATYSPERRRVSRKRKDSVWYFSESLSCSCRRHRSWFFSRRSRTPTPQVRPPEIQAPHVSAIPKSKREHYANASCGNCCAPFNLSPGNRRLRRGREKSAAPTKVRIHPTNRPACPGNLPQPSERNTASRCSAVGGTGWDSPLGT